ncbi:steroid 5-alpha-reductase DET2-like [Papaver somniferum]|uniref:steroid 5-alpha-reductase DET2-like n=1 Tax=Papaver somniferum TaxID=3469 RepID=UPI000E6F7125|nr:steroid 5-alpha-reductase DET2-like [Papaver somniferum]
MVFDKILFPLPSSIFMASICSITLVSSFIAGISESKGNNLPYSKLGNTNSGQKSKKESIFLSNRIGMLIVYTPALLASAISFWVYPNHDFRFLLVTSALALHFFKRDFEVLFVHKYSGMMMLDSAITISLGFFMSTVSMIYNQHLMQGIPDPKIDLKPIEIVVYLGSIIGNFYHRYLLSKLRQDNDKKYKIPKGGLFGCVICPHYMFEILVFVGISLMSRTIYQFCFTLGTICYLTGRSIATRKWYLSKFPNFPRHIKALVPFVF